MTYPPNSQTKLEKLNSENGHQHRKKRASDMESNLFGRDTYASALPSRSRLYHLAPVGFGTPLVESLASYVNRLAWTYRINPRVFIAQEVLPNLQRSDLCGYLKIN
jgi:hypothetical protein